MILLIIILLLIFGGGGGYWYGGRNEGTHAPHFGFGGIVIVLLICWALGLFGSGSHWRF